MAKAPDALIAGAFLRGHKILKVGYGKKWLLLIDISTWANTEKENDVLVGRYVGEQHPPVPDHFPSRSNEKRGAATPLAVENYFQS